MQLATKAHEKKMDLTVETLVPYVQEVVQTTNLRLHFEADVPEIIDKATTLYFNTPLRSLKKPKRFRKSHYNEIRPIVSILHKHLYGKNEKTS